MKTERNFLKIVRIALITSVFVLAVTAGHADAASEQTLIGRCANMVNRTLRLLCPPYDRLVTRRGIAAEWKKIAEQVRRENPWADQISQTPDMEHSLEWLTGSFPKRCIWALCNILMKD